MSDKLNTTVSPKPPTGWGPALIKSLAGLRGLLGLQLLVAPQFTTSLLMLDLGDAPTILPRLIGTRELAIGALTYFAYHQYAESKGRNSSDLQRILLWGNIAVDAGDMLGALLAVFTSPSEVNGGLLLSASGASAACWGILGYQSL